MNRMGDEVYRIFFEMSEPLFPNLGGGGTFWWYLRILRWVRMTVLRGFLMRVFYEPQYGGVSLFVPVLPEMKEDEVKRELFFAEETLRKQ